MNKKVLNNKIGIQIMWIITGAVLIVLGILCTIFNNIYFGGYGHSNNYYSLTIYGWGDSDTAIIIGCAVLFAGVAAVIISSIKIANYQAIKKSGITANEQPDTCKGQSETSKEQPDAFTALQNRLLLLQKLKSDGLISDDEYNELKQSAIKNNA